jgi:hypothetical protein
MGDLKPIGSEKLQGQDKLRRIMEIARFNETIPNTINETSRTEFNRTLSDGNNYEIVKERQGYIIKKTISESETDYIEPMKNRKYYSSYSQALKRLNLVAGELNRINENEEGTSMFGEQKKFTLKTPKPKADDVPVEASAPPMVPPPVPAPELPASPIGGEEMDLGMDSEEMAPEGDIDMDVDASMEVGGSDETVTFKSIQKLTGKLTQKIRTLESQEGMTSEDIKYVINMVLSSFDLNELSEEDREDILSKFEDETEDLGGDDMDGEDLTDDSEVEDIQADMDIPMEGEMDEDMYGSFGNMKRDDYKGDNYYDENDRRVRDSELYGISGDDFDTEEFDTFQKLYDKYGDKQRWFDERTGEKMFNIYKEKTGKPFKVKTRRPMEGEIDEDMYASFGNQKRKDYKGDNYYDENDRRVRDSELYGIAGDDFDTEEFDSFQKLYDKYGDKQRWFDKTSGEKMFNIYKEKTGKPFKVKTRRPMEGEMEEDDYGNGAIIDSIFGESKVDKVISKYFEVSKKEIVEGRERVAKKKIGRIADVKKQMGEVIKLSETIEQELSSQKFLNENFSAKIIGKTNKQNLVFENKGKQVKITPEGQIL